MNLLLFFDGDGADVLAGIVLTDVFDGQFTSFVDFIAIMNVFNFDVFGDAGKGVGTDFEDLRSIWRFVAVVFDAPHQLKKKTNFNISSGNLNVQ